MELYGKCIICKKERQLVTVGSFAKCCRSCAGIIQKRDMKALAEYRTKTLNGGQNVNNHR